MPPNTGTFKVELEGRGLLTIRPSDHIATGGEASVYRAHSTAVKIYTDPGKMRRDGMTQKVKLLKALSHNYICAPEGVVRDTKGEAIGIYLPFAEGEVMPRIFASAYWAREGFDVSRAKKLVDRMREATRFIHDHKAVMVDSNELNWIAMVNGQNGPEPRAIDVDQYSIGSYGPKAIMMSIKDWHTEGFNELTDWFAWGVVTFQIFTGIHPYRGTLDGYTQRDLEKRMKDNTSVFEKGVRLNTAVRDFNSIPGPLLEWYRAVFEKKNRTVPPSPFDATTKTPAPARVHKTVVSGAGALVLDKLFERVNDAVVRVFPCGVVQTITGTLFDLATKREVLKANPHAEVIKVPGGWVIAESMPSAHTFTFVDANTKVAQLIPVSLKALRVTRHENRLFLVTEAELVELKFLQGVRPMLVNGPRTQILLPQSTRWFDGLGIQKVFDSTFLVLPFGNAACITVRAKELDGITPIGAYAGNRFASIVGLDKSGAYQKFEFTFAIDYSSYAAWNDGMDSPELNITILPKGVVAMILEDNELCVYVPSNGAKKKVKDAMIQSGQPLAHWDDTVVMVKDGALWSVKMK